MKRLVSFLLGVIAGVCLAIGVYYLLVGNIEWEKFLEEQVMPSLLLVLGSIGTICLTASPIIKAITEAVSKFNSVTKDVRDTVENGDNANKEIKECIKQVQALNKAINSEIKPMLQEVDTVQKMSVCNTSELVSKGIADKIYNMGCKDEV